MANDEILKIPARDSLGRLLGQCGKFPVIGNPAARLQRVRRKRFLAEIKGTAHQRHVRAVLRHEAGRDLQTALTRWLASPAIGSSEFPRFTARPDRFRCSVVINTVDRSRDLAITLADLEPGWDPVRDELIIVLGPTGDDSEDIVHRSKLQPVLVRCPERNLARSRNLGLEAATGRFVAFIDDDASPEPAWLDELLAPFDVDPAIGVTSGFALDGEGRRFLNRYVVADLLGQSWWFHDESAASRCIMAAPNQRRFLTATGCNMAFRRSTLGKIGGFDPFYRYFLEETDAVLRLLQAGHRCVPAPGSMVRHRLGANIARTPDFSPEQRTTIIRSQLHYIESFARGTVPADEIEAAIWRRILTDLEKIAWDGSIRPDPRRLAEYQESYAGSLRGLLGANL